MRAAVGWGLPHRNKIGGLKPTLQTDSLVRNEGRDMNVKAKKILKNLICAGLSILFITASAKATLVNSNSIVQDGIEYYTQTNKFIYELGENVEILHRVTNLSDEPLTFVFAYQQQCHFEVWDGVTRIWGWPKLVNPAGSGFTLRPGEFKEFLIDWDTMNDNGTLELDDDFSVSPGIYDVLGRLMGGTSDGIIPESVSVPIQIIPEPTTFLLLGSGLIAMLSCRKRKKS
jgi:hypothetical protein